MWDEPIALDDGLPLVHIVSLEEFQAFKVLSSFDVGIPQLVCVTSKEYLVLGGWPAPVRLTEAVTVMRTGE